MRIAILTSSRADYGIYRPLLHAIKSDPFFELKIIAFGTHLSKAHGHTIDAIYADGFKVDYQLETVLTDDTQSAISDAIGQTVSKFSKLWLKIQDEIDLVFALGDRYEMFAAVTSTVPFNLRIAHIHGGEKTAGAIDDKFRHAISVMSNLHFTATEEYADRVRQLIDSENCVYNVGALGLDNILEMDLLTVSTFKDKYEIDLTIPTILNTLHPETVNVAANRDNAIILNRVFEQLADRFQIVITMPNADTSGSVIREEIHKLKKKKPQIITVESFGTLGYFSCMKHCSFLLGNTSSGLIEAPSLNKYVINLGERQAGRARSKNVYDVDFDIDKILDVVKIVEKKGEYLGNNIYKSDQAVTACIIDNLKKI